MLLDYIAMSNVCHLASVTDKEILVELLVTIKKVGTLKEAQQGIHSWNKQKT